MQLYYAVNPCCSIQSIFSIQSMLQQSIHQSIMLKYNLVKNSAFFLLFFGMLCEKSQKENQSGTIYHSAFSASLIFIFTTKRTGISHDFRFSVFGFLSWCRAVCLCAGAVPSDVSAGLPCRAKPPPPQIAVWVYMDR